MTSMLMMISEIVSHYFESYAGIEQLFDGR